MRTRWFIVGAVSMLAALAVASYVQDELANVSIELTEDLTEGQEPPF